MGKIHNFLFTFNDFSKYFNWLNIMIGIVGGAISCYLGGWDLLLETLGKLVVADFVTGVLKSIINKKTSSMLCSTGIIRKITVFIIVAVANSLQALLGNSIPLREIIITFYIGCEGLSILENLGEMGIPFPKKLKDVLLQLKNKEE
jgi:toxin secretion/phage lysis holin